MTKYIIEESTLVGMADQIRALTGTTGPLKPGEMVTKIEASAEVQEENFVDLTYQTELIDQIEMALAGKAAASPTLQSKTVTPSTATQTVTPDSGYDGLKQVTVNAMPTATQATPSIAVSSSGLITATATQTAGYVSAGTKSATKQLTTQAAKTVTPGTTAQTAVASGVYTTGAVTVAGDANLVAGNIKEGVSIFGVTGTHAGGTGGGGASSVETCSVIFDNSSLSFDCPVKSIIAITYEQGEIKLFRDIINDLAECYYHIPNVVCGTDIYIEANIYMWEENGIFIDINGSATYHENDVVCMDGYDRVQLHFTAPTVSNEECVIYYAYDAS